MKKPKIIVAAWHPGSANSVLPVVKQLRAEDKTNVFLLAYKSAERSRNNQELFKISNRRKSNRKSC